MDDGGNEPSTGSGLRGRDLIGLGALLVGAVVGGLVIGLLIDLAAGTEPVFAVIGIFVGIAAAVAGFWRRVKDALQD
jgi:F0F1-type ATP synthase assembly protein I